MRLNNVFTALFVIAAAIGCAGYPGDPITQYSITHRAELNHEMANAVWDEQTANAVVSQRALYPYHFEAGTAELNLLGRRDVKILANRFGGNLPAVSLAKGDASEALYEARRTSVAACFAELGVEVPLERISAGFPGGDGMGTTELLEKAAETESQTTSSGTTSVAGQGFVTGGEK